MDNSLTEIFFRPKRIEIHEPIKVIHNVQSQPDLRNISLVSEKKPELAPLSHTKHLIKLSQSVNTFHKKSNKKILERNQLRKTRFLEISRKQEFSKKYLLQKQANNLRRALDRDLKNQTKTSIIELFESKVKERIQASIRIIKKLRNDNNMLGLSITHAVLGMDLRIVEAHIDECGNEYKRALVVNCKDQYHRSCLHYACSLGQLGSIEMMMMVGADPRIKDLYGRTPLHYAAFQDKKEVVELLRFFFRKACKVTEGVSENTDYRTIARLLKYKKLKKMANVHKPQVYSLKAVPQTVNYLDYSMIDKDMQKHLDRMNVSDNKNQGKKVEVFGIDDYFNNQDDLGRTALHIAALCDKVAIIRILIRYGADPDIKDYNDNRPLELSSSRLASSILLSKMKNPKQLPLEKLFKPKDIEKTIISTKELLLMNEQKINSFLTLELQENYLHLSIKSKNIESVQLLLQRNFNPTAQNKFHWNAVHLAIKSNDLRILSLLVKGHEDIEKDKMFKFQKAWILYS